MYFDFELFIHWFEENNAIQNVAVSHFIYLGKDVENEEFKFNNTSFNAENKRKIIKIIIENKLTFKVHIKDLYK